MFCKPQLSEDIEKCKEEISFTKLVSTKLDGIRAVTVNGTVLTRSLKPLPNNHVREVLSEYQNLDGELIVGSANSESVYRDTFSGVMTILGKPEFVFYVFDDLTDLTLPFQTRLANLVERSKSFPSFIQVLPQKLVESRDELQDYYAKALDLGFEGVIARNPKSLYKAGRCTAKSQDSLKVKPFKDSEAEILEVFEAEENLNEAFTNELGMTERSSHSENKRGNGKAGGFVARDITSGVEFRCSAGKLDHAERAFVWNERKKFVGKLVKYRYLPVGVKDLPRHPRFIGWRSELDM